MSCNNWNNNMAVKIKFVTDSENIYKILLIFLQIKWVREKNLDLMGMWKKGNMIIFGEKKEKENFQRVFEEYMKNKSLPKAKGHCFDNYS